MLQVEATEIAGYEAATGARTVGCAPCDFPRQSIGNAVYAANDFDCAPAMQSTGKISRSSVSRRPATRQTTEPSPCRKKTLFVFGRSCHGLARDDKICWPRHGGPVTEPQRFLHALIRHLRARKTAILSLIAAGDTAVLAIVASGYKGLDPALANAAASSVRAHIEDLVERGSLETNLL